MPSLLRIYSGFTFLCRSLFEEVARQPELFYEITARQDYAGAYHQDTETIFLRWCRSQTVEAAFTEIEAVDYPSLKKLPSAKELMWSADHLVHGLEIGRMILVKFKPGGVIRPHIDEGPYADYYERFHISIDSEVGNCFMVDGRYVHMKPGELWWFNHKKTHSVINFSSTPRLHLIIDIKAPMYRRERDGV